MTETDTTQTRKLVRISVSGLLNRFDHSIEFDPDWRLLIVHGPNGVGKTSLLELIYAAFARRYQRLARIPFRTADFQFDDGVKIQVSRVSSSDEQLPLGIPFPHGPRSQASAKLIWTLYMPGEKPIVHDITPSTRPEDRRRIARLEREMPVEQIEFDLWLDIPTGEELGSYELLERYGHSLSSDASRDSLPSEMVHALNRHKVHLIETQRLLKPRVARRSHPRASQTRQATVVSYAEDLSQRLGKALVINSRTSQVLDRSFPGRLFHEGPPPEAEPQLRKRYAEQLELRTRLANISILDSSTDLDLPSRDLTTWERKVLGTYLNDAAAKLETFQPLLDRLELLRDIVNSRFLFKNLQFDREDGFVFSYEDSELQVDTEFLSSGEQHELVLMYDLLMKVEENSLVLIDEPEISLHVAWQKAFLDDLDRVASLTSLRFIIATHSPQIIGTRWDRTVELYSVPQEDA